MEAFLSALGVFGGRGRVEIVKGIIDKFTDEPKGFGFVERLNKVALEGLILINEEKDIN